MTQSQIVWTIPPTVLFHSNVIYSIAMMLYHLYIIVIWDLNAVELMHHYSLSCGCFIPLDLVFRIFLVFTMISFLWIQSSDCCEGMCHDNHCSMVMFIYLKQIDYIWLCHCITFITMNFPSEAMTTDHCNHCMLNMIHYALKSYCHSPLYWGKVYIRHFSLTHSRILQVSVLSRLLLIQCSSHDYCIASQSFSYH